MRRPLSSHVSPFSLCVVPIEMCRDGEPLGSGTAFFYRFDGRPYLVTNWHNPTGRNPATGQPIAKDGTIPDTVVVCLRGPRLAEGVVSLAAGEPLELAAPDAGEHGWRMHPLGRDVDLAAIALDEDQDRHFFCVNDLAQPRNPAVRVGDDCFILGYPRGLRPTGVLPIWKRGSTATEPAVLPLGEPWLLVDAATREGMSGAPVIVRAFDSAEVDPPSGSLRLDVLGTFPIEPPLAFLGVYSGRMGVADALEAQLGKVWLATAIEEMLTSSKPLDW